MAITIRDESVAPFIQDSPLGVVDIKDKYVAREPPIYQAMYAKVRGLAMKVIKRETKITIYEHTKCASWLQVINHIITG